MDEEGKGELEEESEDEFEFEEIKAHEKALEEEGFREEEEEEEEAVAAGKISGEEEVEANKAASKKRRVESGADDGDFDDEFLGLDAIVTKARQRRKQLAVYQLANYTFGVKVVHAKNALGGATTNFGEKLQRMREKYEETGGIARRSVAGVCVVNQHGCPHVLLLQEAAGATTRATFSLPGGRLRTGEGTTEGLQRKLANKLAAPAATDEAVEVNRAKFEVLDCMAKWYRIAHEPQMYPYLPSHVTKPKETLEVFLVELPVKCYFAVPKTLKLVAVPLFELYDNAEKFGAVAASIPNLLSRYQLNLERDEDK